MRTNLGRVSPLPRGVWEDSASYSKGDIVRRADAAYIALQESSGIEPGASAMWTQYWKLIAYDGNQADLELLTKSLSLANVVIGMEATAESVPFGSPIAVFSSADPTQNSLSLHFQIPRNSDFAPDPPSTVFSLNAGSWEVKVVTGLGGADYSVESLGVQDFSNVQYSFDEGMTWAEFAASGYNAPIGGQFGGVNDTLDAGWQATSGKCVFIYDYEGFEGDSGAIVMFGNYSDYRIDYFERPTEYEIYLDGQVVSPTDPIIAGAHYTVGH